MILRLFILIMPKQKPVGLSNYSFFLLLLYYIALIIYYHYLDLKIFSNHNALKDTNVGLTNTKIFLISIELIICVIHPMPKSYLSSNVNTNILKSYPLSYITTDVGLGIPSMFYFFFFCLLILYCF